MSNGSSQPSPAELLQRLKQRDPIERGRAVEALGQLGDPQHAPSLRPLLDDPDLIVAFKAAVALGWLDDDSGVDLLVRALSKPDLCFMALEALTHLASPGSLAGLRKFFRRRFLHPLERLQAAAALVKLGDEAARTHLETCLDSKRPEERGFALQLWGRLAMPTALSRLQSVLLDPEDHHRLDAVRGLAELGDVRALPMLERTAKDQTDPELAAEAAAAIALLKDQQSRERKART